ncbi:MAG: hypothetical protein WB562_20455 [Candidatus Sulfotelmatobacter sp.]
MKEHSSAELTGLFEYLHIDDEIQTNRLIYAIVRAFNGDKATKKPVDDDEAIIDTTQPEFARQFQGFSGVPGMKGP